MNQIIDQLIERSRLVGTLWQNDDGTFEVDPFNDAIKDLIKSVHDYYAAQAAEKARKALGYRDEN